MKVLVAFFLLFVSSSCFTQNIIDPKISAQEWMDSFGVNMRKMIGKEMKAFSAVADNGTQYTEKSLKKKVTLINFWFESCHPCVAEFPDLNLLHEKFKGDKNFQLLAFTFETPDAIKRIKEKYSLQYDLISVSHDEIHRLNFGYGFPCNMVVDQAGKIAYLLHLNPFSKIEQDLKFNTTLIPAIQKLLETK